ncbi:phage tail completion protein [Escherichia coli]|nr:phage tail completion protein [Escherichia coli]
MAELQKVDDWLSALLANLEPATRSRMMRQLAQELRRTQQAEYQDAAQSRWQQL